MLVGSILNRMIFWELMRVFLLALTGLTAMFLLAGLIPLASQMGLSPRQVIVAIPLFIPSALPYTIPATTLFASCVVYGRLAHDNEVVAIKAAGVHLVHLLKPALALGLLATAATAGLYHTIIPRTQQMLQEQILEDPEEVLYNALRRDRCFRHGKFPYVIYVKDVQGRRLIDVVLKKRGKVKDKNTDEETFLGYDSVARAREARLRVDPVEGKLYIDPDRFVFYDKNTQGVTQSTGPVSVDLPESLSGKEIRGRPMALTWDDLGPRVAELDAERKAIAESREKARVAGQIAGQDRHFQSQIDNVTRQMRNVQAEFYTRPALAVGCLVFALIGCPVGIWANRSDYLSTFVICWLPTMLLYYPLLFAGSNLGKDGKIPLGLGCWLANIAVAAAGMTLTARLLRR